MGNDDTMTPDGAARPQCPYCGAYMERVRHDTYYADVTGWMCDCDDDDHVERLVKLPR